jgi:glyoxylase-like metal-dependent hydrolase (beta-lactamase superfamily II)
MDSFRIGDAHVQRIEEWQGMFIPPSQMFIGYDNEVFHHYAAEFTPGYYSAVEDRYYGFLQSWLLKVDGLNILYDTGAGNDKDRPGIPIFGGLHTDFLNRFSDTGVSPDQIDVVICSHLHIDHVGWNTRLYEGRWVPTFRNARYVFSAIDRDYWDPAGPGPRPTDVGRDVNRSVFEDSVQPLLDSGQAEIVQDGHQVSESLTLQLGPGHTPGHLVTHLSSRGQHALFVGDIFHHPIQVRCPHWNSIFCEDPDQARRTRRRVLDMAVETGALLIPAHFGGAHYCRVERSGDDFVPLFVA